MGEIESALIAAGVAAAVSLVVLYIKEKYFEPHKIKRQRDIETTQKKIEVYGKLTALLGSAEEQGRGHPACIQSKTTHFLDHPKDDDKLKEIFQNHYSLFPFELNDLYFKFTREQKTFSTLSSGSGKKFSYTVCNLNEMQEIVLNELVDNKKEYDDLTS